MGKKGKKKAKITGTPDVVKFKQTREFWLLKECVTLQESLPFVALDAFDETSYKRVARFLNMVGLLAEHLQIQTKKDYRFNMHHKYLAPMPQFFPFGFDIDVIRQAREIQDRRPVQYNGILYNFEESLQQDSENFLKDVDSYISKIPSEIEPRLKDDFATGLKHFKSELKDNIKTFDDIWMLYEKQLVEARHGIHCNVFEIIERLVKIELNLTQAEDRLDIETKQQKENEFVKTVNELTHRMFPETAQDYMPEDVIPLAEACIFYESKCSEEWLHLAKHLIKDYLELRMYVMRIPEERLLPNLKENQQLMRLLMNFHSSVLLAREALDFVSRLPKLIHAKTTDWMTKHLLEPDLTYYQKTAHLLEA